MMRAYVGLGSNLGERVENLSRAVDALADMPESHLLAVSHVYESQPWGVTEQPPFANAVAVVETDLSAEQLVDLFGEIEDALGRDREVEPNGPRVIDLDLLLLGDTEQRNDKVEVPHPRMAERDFVITPLLEVDPDVTWPDGTPVTRDAVTEGAVISDLGPLPDWGAETGEPVLAADWVDVAEHGGVTDMQAALDAGLYFKRSVLEEEGIPVVFWPYDPGDANNAFGQAKVFKLRVPAADAERARELLAAVEAAKPEFPDFE